MTIRKGEEWGTPVVAPDGILQVASDDVIALHQSDVVMSLEGGDLFEALGCPQVVTPGAMCTLLPVDAIHIEVTLPNGTTQVMRAASCVEIGSFSPRFGQRSRYVCISNAGIVKNRNLTPRAHPNDGFLDVLHVSKEIALRDRLQAMKRSHTGTHIPHPDISATRGTEFAYDNDGNRETLHIDHRKFSSWTHIHITVIPDYWKIVV